MLSVIKLNVAMLSVIMLSVILLSVILLSVILLSVILLSVILLSVILLSVILLSVILLNVVMLKVVMLNVVTPLKYIFYLELVHDKQKKWDFGLFLGIFMIRNIILNIIQSYLRTFSHVKIKFLPTLKLYFLINKLSLQNQN